MNIKQANQHDQSRWFSLLQFSSICFSAPMLIYTFIQLLNYQYSIIILLPTFLLAYFTADIITGTIHWAGDTLGDEYTPFFGSHFVKPFRLHHTDQKLMTRVSHLENLGASFFLIITPQLFLLLLMNSVTVNLIWNSLFLFLNSLYLSTALTNLLHRWAHIDKNQLPKFVVFLQKHHLILNPTHHQIHHQYPYRTYFCVTNGWANKLLTQINYWNKLERIAINFDQLFKTDLVDKEHYESR